MDGRTAGGRPGVGGRAVVLDHVLTEVNTFTVDGEAERAAADQGASNRFKAIPGWGTADMFVGVAQMGCFFHNMADVNTDVARTLSFIVLCGIRSPLEYKLNDKHECFG